MVPPLQVAGPLMVSAPTPPTTPADCVYVAAVKAASLMKLPLVTSSRPAKVLALVLVSVPLLASRRAPAVPARLPPSV